MTYFPVSIGAVRGLLIGAAVVLVILSFLPLISARSIGEDTGEGDALLRQARQSWKDGRYDSAVEAYSRLRDEFPEHAFVQGGDAQFWLWCSLGNAGKTHDEIERFLKDYPDPSLVTSPPFRGLSACCGAAGPSAFPAPVGANHGYACLPERYLALSEGLPLGEVKRRRYNEIVFAAGGKLDVMLFELRRHRRGLRATLGGGVDRR